MEKIRSSAQRAHGPTLSVHSNGRINLNPEAMELIDIELGTAIDLYADTDPPRIGIEPCTRGDYKLHAHPASGWGGTTSLPLINRLDLLNRKGHYPVTVTEHPDDPARRLLIADLS